MLDIVCAGLVVLDRCRLLAALLIDFTDAFDDVGLSALFQVA